MMKKVYRSKCCDREVKTEGVPDFLGSKDVCTVGFVCLKCNQPCDVKERRRLEMNIKSFVSALHVVLKEVNSKAQLSPITIAYLLEKKQTGLHPHLNIRFSIVEWLCLHGEAGLESLRKRLPQLIQDAQYYDEELSGTP